MNSAWNRWNTVLMILMVNAVFIACVTQFTNQYLHDTTPIVHKLEVAKVARLRSERSRDRAILQLNFDMDLSNLFDWNCKQVFVFIEAEYSVPGRKSNRVVVWDDVIHTKEHAKRIKGNGVYSKYEVDDVSAGLKGTNFTLKVGYDTMPFLGLVGNHFQLRFVKPVNSFIMPTTYGKF